MSTRAQALGLGALLASSACASGNAGGPDAAPTEGRDAAPRDAATANHDAADAAGGDSGPRETGVLLFGGYDGDLLLDDMWIWNGEDWREIVPDGEVPAARIDHAMVYDEARGRVVLFGGTTYENEQLADTWEWDGARWQELTPAAEGPAPRFWHAMAYDAGRERVVLFGGTTDGIDYRGDTWEWDGEQWHDVSPRLETSPARASHAMAYDPVGERVLLFGGDAGGFNRPEDTWAWVGR
jgi:hypothetical protein